MLVVLLSSDEPKTNPNAQHVEFKVRIWNKVVAVHSEETYTAHRENKQTYGSLIHSQK